MSRVLVVDDSKSVRHLIEIILQKEHYKVDACNNGREAFEILKTNTYDLIISDEDMPVMSGSELAAT